MNDAHCSAIVDDANYPVVTARALALAATNPEPRSPNAILLMMLYAALDRYERERWPSIFEASARRRLRVVNND